MKNGRPRRRAGGGKPPSSTSFPGFQPPIEVIVDGVNIVPLPEVLRDRYRALKIGFVFQTFNLLPAFSALENVLLGMSFSGKKVDRPRATELLKRVGLSHRLNYSPARMSVGEQQRVAVARALANHPTMLLADEPTASVDRANQQNILQLIRETCREQDCSLLLVTHSADVADQFDRVEKLSEFNRVGGAA
ncbi:MAG: ATP-binding cassette domain-containing protein [Planctomycetales bacterium]